MYGVRACVRVRVPRKEMVAPIHDICFSHQGQHLLGHALGELRVLQRVSSDFEEAALCAVGHSLDVGAGGAVVVCRRGAVTAEAAGVRRAVRVVRALRPTPTDHGRRLTIDESLSHTCHPDISTMPIRSFHSFPCSSSWITPWIVDTWLGWPYSFIRRGSVPMGISLRVLGPVP
eukprot:SAG25_NODE_454_length_7870_cov_2.720499_3_plen_174_part_00